MANKKLAYELLADSFKAVAKERDAVLEKFDNKIYDQGNLLKEFVECLGFYELMSKTESVHLPGLMRMLSAVIELLKEFETTTNDNPTTEKERVNFIKIYTKLQNKVKDK